MPDILRGPSRVLAFAGGSGGGGDVAVLIRPPVGELWDVYMARGSHDGAAGLQCDWYFVDTIGPTQSTFGGGAAQPRLMNTDIGQHNPIRVNYNCYIAFQVIGMAAGRTVTIYCCVERIVGAAMQGA